MYGLLAGWLERFLRIPPAPGPPPGDEGSTRVFRASPRYYLYRLLAWAISRLAVGASLVAGAGALTTVGPLVPALLQLMLGLMIVGFVVQSFLSYLALRLDYEKRWYLVTNRSLRIRQGVVGVSEMTISFANIQNISITQGPLQRLFGISDLRVDTAGGAGAPAQGTRGGHSLHTAFFQGVDDAERIRSLMQERLQQLRDAGLGDTDDTADTVGHDLDSLPPPPGYAEPSDALQLLHEIRVEAAALARAAAR